MYRIVVFPNICEPCLVVKRRVYVACATLLLCATLVCRNVCLCDTRLRNTRHVAPAARCPAHRHPRLQVVDQIRNQRDQDEQDQDDQEDDNVALHLGMICCESTSEDRRPKVVWMSVGYR